MLASRFPGINNDNVSCLRCCSWRQRQRPFPIHTQFPALQPSQSYYLCIVACDLWICEIRLALYCTLALFFFPSPVRVQCACVCVCFASLSISNIARRRRPAPVCSLKQPLKRQGKQQEQPSVCVYKNGIPVRVAPHTITREEVISGSSSSSSKSDPAAETATSFSLLSSAAATAAAGDLLTDRSASFITYTNDREKDTALVRPRKITL